MPKNTLALLLVSIAGGLGCSSATVEPFEHGADVDDDYVAQLAIGEGLDAEEAAFLSKINEYRASKGLGALGASIALTRAADGHAVDMANKNYFSHTSQDGTSFSTRVKREYPYNTTIAENIAAGNATAAATFEQWKNSPGHDANMTSPNYKVIGIARAYSATSAYRWYWVTNFGGYVDEVMTEGGATPPPPPPPTAANLLANGGFEAGGLSSVRSHADVRAPGGWSSTVGATRLAGSAAAGAFGVRVVDPDPGTVAVAQIVGATSGRSYALSAKARRTAGAGRQSIWVDFLDGNFTRLSRARAYATTGSSFVETRTSGVAPTGTVWARIVIYGNATSGVASTYDWDDVTLVAQ
jgi:uncharacterized protein YkwD